MDRRGLVQRILALIVATVALVGFTEPRTAGAVAAPSDDSSTPTTVTEPTSDADRPVPTVSDFYPEDANLSDCLGLVQRPGCGSEARGGWRQTAVFGVILVGMGLIAWRISVGIRKNRAAMAPEATTSDITSPDTTTSDTTSPDTNDT